MTSLPGADLGLFSSLAEYLQNITEALAATGTPREVVEIVLTPAVKALGAVAGIVLLVDQTDQQLKIAGSQGYEDGTLTVWQEAPLEDHVLIADILRMREAMYFEHAGALKEAYPNLEHRTGALAAVANVTLPMFLDGPDGQPLGVIVLDFTEPHHFTPAERHFLTILSAQCAVALGRAEATRTLEARVEERTRQLEERTRQLEAERAALEVFVAFTETVGGESDLVHLVKQAITVLRVRFPGASAAFYELEEDHWRARVWSDDVSPALAAMIAAELPVETPVFAQALQSRQAVFTDAWDAGQERVTLSEEYSAAAIYPLIANTELHGLLTVGLRDTRNWSEADQGLVRAIGRGLNLALERTETARQLSLQNAELKARTRALEAFAELTRDLVLTTDPLLLIRRAQEVVMSMLSDGGAAMYFEPEGERWFNRVQHGRLGSPELQATIDAGLPYAEATNLLIPWTSGRPHFQDVYDRTTTALTSLAGTSIAATATLPLVASGARVGVLAFALVEQRSWSSVDRVVLETAVQSLELALDRAAKTRRLEEERVALEAFTHFTEAVGSVTEVQALVRQAITLLHDTCGVDAVYLERGDKLFRATAWSPEFDPALLARLKAGFPLQRSSLALVLRTNTAAFIDHWDPVAQRIEESAHLRAVAGHPVFQDGEMQSVLLTGSRTSATWSEWDKGILQAVGRSLNLALDRALHAQELTVQRDALDARTQQLAASTKELEAFSYSVSHDLRTPVRHMLGFLRLAQKSLDGRLDERSARYLDMVEQAGTQMNTLIDALLDLSRAAQRTLRLMRVDLNEIMLQIRTTLLPDLLTRNVQWEVAPLPTVQGDPDALKQVMTQLTENALKFTRTRDPALIKVWAEDVSEGWKVSVQDNGLGFDPQYQDRLFNLFQRLHTAQEASGTGVGLASVRRLILKHGGQVFAEGQVDQGATFGFTLPKKA